VIQHVRVVPWDEEHLIPVLPFEGSREFHARIPPGLHDYKVRWGDTRFTFDTIKLWDSATEGFRTGPLEWPMDVVAVGDSFTFCWTDFDDCWVERLHLDYGWHVTNLGVPGTGSMAHHNLLEPYARPLEPAVIVWQWFGNDYKDDYDFALMRGEDAPASESAPPPAPPVDDYGWLAEYSTVYRYLRDWLDEAAPATEGKDLLPVIQGRQIAVSDAQFSHDLDNEAVRFGFGETLRAFESGQAFADDIGAALVILLIPTKEEAFADYLAAYLEADYLDMLARGRAELLRACEEHDWRCIDMTDTLRAAIADGETVYNAFDFHLDAAGNQLVADTLAQYFMINGLLEPRADS
jgi:hypothetical protein